MNLYAIHDIKNDKLSYLFYEDEETLKRNFLIFLKDENNKNNTLYEFSEDYEILFIANLKDKFISYDLPLLDTKLEKLFNLHALKGQKDENK